MNVFAILSIGALILMITKTATRPELKHFKPSEFGLWYPLMNAELLTKLDAFREAWGAQLGQ